MAILIFYTSALEEIPIVCYYLFCWLMVSYCCNKYGNITYMMWNKNKRKKMAFNRIIDTLLFGI